jgi:hypothetical protein
LNFPGLSAYCTAQIKPDLFNFMLVVHICLYVRIVCVIVNLKSSTMNIFNYKLFMKV